MSGKPIFHRYLFFFFFICPAWVMAQNNNTESKYTIAFKKDKDTLLRSSNKDELMQVELIASNTKADEFKEHKLNVTIDLDETTLPKKDYEIITDISGTEIKNLKSEKNIYRIIIKKDDADDKQVKDLKLVLKLSVKKKVDNDEEDDDATNNEGEYIKIVLVIRPAEYPLESYRYLGYLGTNFDLVDGIEANKVFFAVNILIPETKVLGINLGVYGNRTMTKTDTSFRTSFTSRIDAYGTDSVIYFQDTAIRINKQVSDNIGAFFSPIFPLKFIKEGNLKVYYAPNFEFIWRRSKFETTYINNATVRKDTLPNRFPINTVLPLVTPLTFKYDQNIYDVYLGLAGLLFRFETEDISIRLSGAFGVNFKYMPIGGLVSQNIIFNKTTSLFFQGRLWITEPTTGLTIGAEISNVLGSYKGPVKYSKAQPFYNVTLSKAFNLKNLATIVKPLTSR